MCATTISSSAPVRAMKSRISALTVAGLNLSVNNITLNADGSFAIASATLALPGGFGGGSRTHTLFMSLSRKMIRFVDTIHREDLSTPAYFDV